MKNKVKNSVVVVGSGGIANRHIKNIKKYLKDISIIRVSSSGRILSKKESKLDCIFNDIESALELKPIWGIIASPATCHIEHLFLFNKKYIPVLVEKPLSTSVKSLRKYNLNKDIIYIGYNLRFLDSTQYISKILSKKTLGNIYSIQVEVGQYLPDWRATNYKKSVSAQAKLGGGAILELSHEIDYINLLFGKIKYVSCIKSKVSNLNIDVEDNVDAILINESGHHISLHLDFLQRIPNRTCKIICEKGNIYWNLKNNSVAIETKKSNKKIVYKSNETRNNSYIKQLIILNSFSKINKNKLANYNDGLEVLKIIDALNLSNKTRKQVTIR